MNKCLKILSPSLIIRKLSAPSDHINYCLTKLLVTTSSTINCGWRLGSLQCGAGMKAFVTITAWPACRLKKCARLWHVWRSGVVRCTWNMKLCCVWKVEMCCTWKVVLHCNWTSRLAVSSTLLEGLGAVSLEVGFLTYETSAGRRDDTAEKVFHVCFLLFVVVVFLHHLGSSGWLLLIFQKVTKSKKIQTGN